MLRDRSRGGAVFNKCYGAGGWSCQGTCNVCWKGRVGRCSEGLIEIRGQSHCCPSRMARVDLIGSITASKPEAAPRQQQQANSLLRSLGLRSQPGHVVGQAVVLNLGVAQLGAERLQDLAACSYYTSSSHILDGEGWDGGLKQLAAVEECSAGNKSGHPEMLKMHSKCTSMQPWLPARAPELADGAHILQEGDHVLSIAFRVMIGHQQAANLGNEGRQAAASCARPGREVMPATLIPALYASVRPSNKLTLDGMTLLSSRSVSAWIQAESATVILNGGRGSHVMASATPRML